MLLGCGLIPGRAVARKKVVVLSFSGPRGGDASRQVARALRGRFSVIGQGQLARAARRLGTNIRSSRGRSMAARALRVSAVIGGSIRRVGSRWVLRVEVFSGATGRRTGIANFPLRGTRVDAGTARRVPGGLRSALARARPGAPIRGVKVASARRTRTPRRRTPRRAVRPRPRRRPQPVVQPRPRHRRRPQPVVQPRPRPKRSDFDDGTGIYTDGGEPLSPSPTPTTDEDEFSTPRRAVADEPRTQTRVARRDSDNLGFEVKASDSENPDNLGIPQYNSGTRRRGRDDTRITRRAETRPPWEKIFEISVGIMLLNREFDFNDPIHPLTPSNYRSGLVPALLAEGAIYPLSYFHRGPLANLGIVARYFRVIYLRSQMPGQVEPLDTTLHDFEIGLRYRWNILGKATSPTLKAGLEFGRLGFNIHDDPSKPVPLPDVAYLYLKLALVGVSVPFYAGSSFSIGASGNFDYLLIFSSGDIERTEKGSYGRSSTGGIDINVGLWASYKGFFARLNGFYRRIFFDFDNACYPISGCYAAGGALDVYKGGYLSMGYAY